MGAGIYLEQNGCTKRLWAVVKEAMKDFPHHEAYLLSGGKEVGIYDNVEDSLQLVTKFGLPEKAGYLISIDLMKVLNRAVYDANTGDKIVDLRSIVGFRRERSTSMRRLRKLV